MIDKKLVHQRFAKNLENYNENAKIQKRMAERLISFIKISHPKKVLEIGCGTGFLTKHISESINYETFIAIDIVEECKQHIHDINPNIKFITADIEDFLKENNETYDLIISNASLQWIDDFEGAIKALKDKLNPNGELIFSTFGNENFREIYHVLGTSLKYYSIIELNKMFPNATIEPEIHIMAFDTPKDVLKHLQLTGVNAIENTHWTKKDLINFENGYKNFCSKRPTLTYNPIYIKILSPSG